MGAAECVGTAHAVSKAIVATVVAIPVCIRVERVSTGLASSSAGSTSVAVKQRLFCTVESPVK